MATPTAPDQRKNAAPKQSFAYQAARASVYAPLIGIVLNILTSASQNGQRPADAAAMKMTGGLIACSMILIGFVLGIIALLKRNGEKGVLGFAITGVLMNSFFIATGIWSIIILKDLHDKMQRERSSPTQQVAPQR